MYHFNSALLVPCGYHGFYSKMNMETSTLLNRVHEWYGIPLERTMEETTTLSDTSKTTNLIILQISETAY